MKLPNPERAVVDIGKLRGYCLNPTHLRGRHKARVFKAAIGLTASDAEFLRLELLRAAMTYEAIGAGSDQHGQRYMIDFRLVRHGREAAVRSFWIVITGEDVARLATCYVL